MNDIFESEEGGATIVAEAGQGGRLGEDTHDEGFTVSIVHHTGESPNASLWMTQETAIELGRWLLQHASPGVQIITEDEINRYTDAQD